MLSRREFFEELNIVKKRLNAVERALSQYINTVHKDSTDSISESESVITDLEIGLADVQNKLDELSNK